jgi:L-lactate dehydrogenase complex protein LldG
MVEDPRMSERDNIMARIREALARGGPQDHGPRTTGPLSGGQSPGGQEFRAPAAPLPTPGESRLPDAAEHRRVLPAVGSGLEAELSLFQKNVTELHADFRLVKGQAALGSELKTLCAAEQWQRLASHHGELTDPVCKALGLPVLFTDAPFDKRELAGCDAGISECDALIAQTGTVVVTSRSTGGRALSVLPPHHVVLARRAQLVADLPAAFKVLKAKYGASYPSMISLITGPSRTGDIERILVLGAHGPKKLTILCW